MTAGMDLDLVDQMAMHLQGRMGSMEIMEAVGIKTMGVGEEEVGMREREGTVVMEAITVVEFLNNPSLLSHCLSYQSLIGSVQSELIELPFL